MKLIYMRYVGMSKIRDRRIREQITISQYRRRAGSLLAIIAIATCLVMGTSTGASAIEGSINSTTGPVATRGAYEVSNIQYNAVVNKDHSYDVKEAITVTIPEPDTLARIDFSIPSGNFRVSDISVDGVGFESRIQNQGSLISIIDLEELTPGVHTYNISYKIREFADRDEAWDLLYFTIIPPESRQPIFKATFTVTFPEDFPLEDIDIFAGHLGAQDTTGLVSEIDAANHSITIEGKLIPENFGLTLKADLFGEYWKGAIDGIWAVYLMMAVMGGITLILLVLWLIGGRDPKPAPTHETKPIDGVSPIEIGYIFNNIFNSRDMTRLIMYFATKGYLRISEYEHKKYRLYRMQDPVSEEKHIRNAYNILFEDVFVGRSIDLSDIGTRLIRIEAMLQDSVAAGFTTKDKKSATTLSRVFRIIGLSLLVVGITVVNALQYSYQYVKVGYIESILLGICAGLFVFALCILEDRKFYSLSQRTGISHIICAAVYLGIVAHLVVSIITKTGSVIAAGVVAVLMIGSALLVVLMRARGKENAVLVMRLMQLRKFIAHPVPKDLLANYLEDENYYYDMMIYALTFGSEESWAISFLPLSVREPEWYSDDIEGNAFSNIRQTPTTIDYAKDLRAFVSTLTSGYQSILK